MGKTEALHLVQIYLLELPPITLALCACNRAFPVQVETNLVLGGIILPDATISARCTTYANNVFMLVTSSVEIDKFGKEMQTYEIITGMKISSDKSVGLWLDLWTGSPLLGSFS